MCIEHSGIMDFFSSMKETTSVISSGLRSECLGQIYQVLDGKQKQQQQPVIVKGIYRMPFHITFYLKVMLSKRDNSMPSLDCSVCKSVCSSQLLLQHDVSCACLHVLHYDDNERSL